MQQSELTQRIGAQLSAETDPAVREFAALLGREANALAVLFYGSNLRTKSLEGVLDFYVLLPGAQVEKIWPRVSYREWEYTGVTLRAKIATMSLETFGRAARGESRDTTVWARFVQPSALVWYAGDPEAAQVADIVSQAARTAARAAIALGPTSGTAEDYWRALFRATYKAEFRVEKAGREDSILSVNQAHFEGLLPLALLAERIPFERDGQKITPQMPEAQRASILGWWKTRRRLGKALNLTRLVKASTTFEGAGSYAAWKVERHTGIPVKVTPFREKHPVLAAPSVLYQVWRARRKG